MYLNEIDFPNKIIDAIRNNTLVVFAGAGASMGKPTALPNFEVLARKIAEGTGSELKKNDSCEVFLGALKAKGIDVNQQAADILSGNCLKYNKLHEAIVDLFESVDKIKIVTTNFDQMFERVVESRNEKVTVYNVPAIPLGNDIEGIIHIHGNVNNPKYMIVTDEDFGRAYLTDGYASKFMVQLFESYTVLFIGYSYNDTIMRYLTRAISRRKTNKRYILTDDQTSDWSIFGIEPIYFPKRGFAIESEGLVRLGRVSKKGLIEWKSQFVDIKDMPPKDLTIDTEIDYCLEDYDRSAILANSVCGKEWLEYLDQKNVFAECFSNDGGNAKKDELWAEWLCNNCVGKNDEALLSLINHHQSIMSSKLAEQLIHRLMCEPYIDTNYYMEYILVLDKHIMHYWPIMQIVKVLASKEQFHAAFILYKKLFMLDMHLTNKGWLQSDSVEYKHGFIGDYYSIEHTWNVIKARAINEFPYEIILFIMEKILELHAKYEMVGQASKDKEPWDLTMLALEKREEYHREDPLQILSEMLLDASISLQNQNKELLRHALVWGISSESTLLRNMTLKAIREVHIFSYDEKLDILLNYNLIHSIFCREQVFLLVAKIFPHLGKEKKESLLDAIEKRGEENASEYEVYNWYVWLNRIEPTDEKVSKRKTDIQIRHEYEPRKHPELLMESSPAKWIQDQSPLSEEQLIQLSASEIVNKLKNYNEDPFEGPSRHGLLDVFSTVVSKNIDWSKNIIHCLIQEKISINDIWQSVFRGLQNAVYDTGNVLSILMLIIQSIELIGSTYFSAECLWSILRRNDIKDIFAEREQAFYDISEILWNNREQDKLEFERTLDATVNTTLGCILSSWIYMISLTGRREIPQRYKSRFEESLQLQAWEKNIAVCILVGHFDFFCYRDMEWSKKTLMPFLLSEDEMLYSSAWEGMTFFSGRINKDTADIIAPAYFKAIKHIHWLNEETNNVFIERLLKLMIVVIKKPTLKYIPEFYRNTSAKEQKQFIQTIKHQLKNMDEDNKIKWWNTWLKHFLDNRKSNKPCAVGDEENEAIVDLLPDLPEVFDEAVDIICKGKMTDKTGMLFWKNLNESHVASKHSHSMAKFLTKALLNVTSLSFGEEDIREIVGELIDLEPKEHRALREVLLKWNIDVMIE